MQPIKVREEQQLKVYQTRFPESSSNTSATKFLKFFKMLVSIFKKDALVFRPATEAEITKKNNDKMEEMLKEEQEFERIESLRKKLNNEVDKLIRTRDEHKLLMVFSKGYELSREQFFSIINGFDEFPQTQKHALSYFETVYKNQMNTEMLDLPRKIKLYDIFKNGIEDYDDMQEVKTHFNDFEFHPFYDQSMAEIVTDFSLSLGKLWQIVDIKEHLKDEEFALTFLNSVNTFKDSLNDFKFLGRINIEKQIDEMILYINENHQEAIDHQYQAQLSQYNEVFYGVDDIRETVIQDLVKNVQKFREKKFPLTSQAVLQEIHQIYMEINKEDLPIEHQLELDNLYEKNLKSIIEDYMTISPRYEATLALHNEHPEALLLKNLQEIKEGVSRICDFTQEQKITNLKVRSVYLKSKN